MNKATNNNENLNETNGSSEKAIPVSVPNDIRSPKFARAYAHGFTAARAGKYLDYVAPAFRWAIARGWKDGEAAREAAHVQEQADVAAMQAAMEIAPF